MRTGVVLLHFGEPASPTYDDVVEYLTRIFLANASIEPRTDQSPQERAEELAERRAPSLLEEYEAIGGSPLHAQAHDRAELIEAELHDRGFDALTYVGMQYTEPSISDAVSAALDDGVDRIIGLPLYPLCGPSTTIASLDELATAIESLETDIPWDELTGWHRHQTYNQIRADAVREYVRENTLEVTADETVVMFSAHGTPLHYITNGSRYVEYVEEYCEIQAGLLGIDSYELGYQNHENRGVEWTEPSIETVIEETEASRVVVEPVSFIHEQSETLSELDIDLREDAQERGIEFHRVPVPHDDSRFKNVFADLLEPFLADIPPDVFNLHRCQCRGTENAFCLNASRSRGLREEAMALSLDPAE